MALQVELVGDFRLLLAESCLKSLEPDLIILDEPTGGLSLSETRKVLKFVNSSEARLSFLV